MGALADREHAQIAEHLALVRQKGGVAALPAGERLYVVRHLSVEKLGRVCARERELAALAAIQQRTALGQLAVLAPGWRRVL